MKDVVFLRHENSKLHSKLLTLWLTKSQTAALLAAHVSTNAQWALFQKATSMSLTLMLALVAEPALAHARTKQSLKTNLKRNPVKRKKSLAQLPQQSLGRGTRQTFFDFFRFLKSLASYLLSMQCSLKTKIINQIT